MIKEDLKFLLRLFLSFGFPKGVALFIKFKLGFVGDLKLPNLKHPIALRANTSDIPTFYQVFLTKEYDINVKNPKIIIDGGANIGLFALRMINQYPEARIICIEPDIKNFELLQKNTALYSGITCENCGIWNKDTILKVYDKYNSGQWGMVVEEDLADGDIPAVSINTLLERHSIDCIDIFKIDIETSEKQLFADNYMDWLPKVKTIVIELHDWIEEGCAKTFFDAIGNSFDAYKYKIQADSTIIENRS